MAVMVVSERPLTASVVFLWTLSAGQPQSPHSAGRIWTRRYSVMSPLGSFAITKTSMETEYLNFVMTMRYESSVALQR